MTKNKFFTYFDPPPVTETKVVGESMTHQECIEDTRIDNVIARCIVNPRVPMFGDFSSISSNISATEVFNLKKESEDILNELNDIRNDPAGDSQGLADSEHDEKGSEVNENTGKS